MVWPAMVWPSITWSAWRERQRRTPDRSATPEGIPTQLPADGLPPKAQIQVQHKEMQMDPEDVVPPDGSPHAPHPFRAASLTHDEASAKVSVRKWLDSGQTDTTTTIWTAFDGSEFDGIAPIVLLRSGWIESRAAMAKELASEARRSSALPMRQALPPGASFTAAELHELCLSSSGPRGELPIVMISHAWFTQQHPDPEADQLIHIAAPLEEMRRRYPAFPSEVAVFYDYSSMLQKDQSLEYDSRSPTERRSFKFGLRLLNLLFAHQLTTMIRLSVVPPRWDVPDFSRRAWPLLEENLAFLVSLSDPSTTTSDADSSTGSQGDSDETGNLSSARGWSLCMDAFRPIRRSPPLPPTQFRLLIGDAWVSENAAHPREQVLEEIGKLHAQMWRESLASVETLDFSFLGWGDAELEALEVSLRVATSLRHLDLSGNVFSDAGCVTLASALEPLRSLRHISLARNESATAGMAVLLEACRGRGMQILT